MTQSDWIGAGISIGLHLALVLLFASLTASSPPPRQLGYVEVEFGDFRAGQPVDATEEAKESTSPEPKDQTPETEDTPQEQPEKQQTEPVDLPTEEQPTDETVTPTDEDPNPKQTDSETKQKEVADKQKPSAEPGENTGDPGEGTTEEASAPYNIEGLDRNPQFAPLPEYTANVNARIRVRITVNPEGRIIRRVPLIKGNPELEAAVMNALQRWRFNALPPAAPQEPQTGVITFTFRLE